MIDAHFLATHPLRKEEQEEEAKLKEELKELRLLLHNEKNLTTQISKMSVISNQSFEQKTDQF